MLSELNWETVLATAVCMKWVKLRNNTGNSGMCKVSEVEKQYQTQWYVWVEGNGAASHWSQALPALMFQSTSWSANHFAIGIIPNIINEWLKQLPVSQVQVNWAYVLIHCVHFPGSYNLIIVCDVTRLCLHEVCVIYPWTSAGQISWRNDNACMCTMTFSVLIWSVCWPDPEF